MQHDDEKTRLQTRVRDLEIALGQKSEVLLATFRLPPVMNNLFGLLLSVPSVTEEIVRQRLEIAPNAKVAVHRLRKQLKKFCETNNLDPITIHSRRNVGYWLEDADKLRIREFVAQKVRGAEVTPQVVVSNDNVVVPASADEILAEV
jgi:hypothetical protein